MSPIVATIVALSFVGFFVSVLMLRLTVWLVVNWAVRDVDRCQDRRFQAQLAKNQRHVQMQDTHAA